MKKWGEGNQVSILKKSRALSRTNKKYPLEEKIPNNIMIEVTNTCNLKCKMCYNQNMKRKKGFMSLSLFKRIVDDAHELRIENMGLYTTGESFLHPLIFDFIKYAKKKGIKYVYITTNGQALNDDMIERIVDSGLDSIKFSIDSGNKKDYEYLKEGANWGKLISIIKKMRATRDKKVSGLKIFGSFIVTKNNYDDIINYNNVFSDLIDETLYTIISNQGSKVDVSGNYPENINPLMNKLFPSEVKQYPCPLLWNRIIVTYDGYLTICCIDFENQLLYGNLNTESLKECWNNKRMKIYRKIHKNKDFSKLSICNNCDIIKRDREMIKKINKKVNKMLLSKK